MREKNIGAKAKLSESAHRCTRKSDAPWSACCCPRPAALGQLSVSSGRRPSRILGSLRECGVGEV